jgi:hypothetical protein
MKYIVFNETTMWEKHNALNLESESSTPNKLCILKDLLGLQDQEEAFSRRDRGLLSYLLAFALFRLYDSPWISTLCDETVFLYPHSDCDSHLHQWRPHVHCDFKNDSNNQNNREYMAAFGVLVMELQAGKSAKWTDDDLDWETNTNSNQVRLSRILGEWKRSVPSGYRHVSKACHDFESLIETFYHRDVACNSLAIIYKCIVEPLFQILERDFGDDAQLFEGIPSPWEGPKVAEQTFESLELFDDLDMAGSHKK